MNYVDYIKQSPLKSFTRGESLLQKGEPSEFLMAVRTGFVKVTAINHDGVERLIWIAGRYDLAPLERLFSKSGSVRFFYTALTDGTYYRVNKRRFLEDAEQTPDLMRQIAQGMSDHYDDLLQRIDAVDTSNVRERLLYTALYVAERFNADDDVDLFQEGLRLTHADFAHLIGSTRETTSLMMKTLQQEGYLDYSRKHLVVHTARIRALLEA